jgi:kynureninase
MYGLLVTSEDDLVGLVAYSLYKRHKISFLESHFAAQGQQPTVAEIQAFSASMALPVQRVMYLEKANSLLEAMNEELLEDAIKRLDKNYKKKLVEELKKGKGFWASLWENILANLAAIVVLAIATFVIYAQNVGSTPEAFGKLFGYEVKRKDTAPQ